MAKYLWQILAASVRRWFHCMRHMLPISELGQHRAETVTVHHHGIDWPVSIYCTCGKVFYSMPVESTKESN